MIRLQSLLSVALLLICCPLLAAQPVPSARIDGLKIPASAVVGSDGKTYVAVAGELGKDGDGAVLRIENGKPVPFAAGLDDPSSITVFQQTLYIADKDRIWRINPMGKAEVFVKPEGFPTPPKRLTDLTTDPENGQIYVADAGAEGQGGAVYRVTPQGRAQLVLDQKKLPSLHTPSGLVLDGTTFLLLADSDTGEVQRVRVTDGSTEKLLGGLGSPSCLIWDHYGRLFIGDSKAGKLWVVARPGLKPALLAEGFQSIGDIGLDPAKKAILVCDPKAGTLSSVPIRTPGYEVDETPLPLQTTLAFPDLKWAGWKGVTDAGAVAPLRPIVLTHAGDGSNRVFVATQHGVIHVFPNDQQAKETKVFLDIQDRVSYSDNQNEEGFLGLAFHPKYKDNGEFFVFYTLKKPKLTNIVSRFRVSKDDPNRADPASEVELLRFTKPFWNHDGGTIVFGPDGYLYVTHGDGGAANDPYDNGQKLSSLLGKVLRIDVDHTPSTPQGESSSPGVKYSIPKDNPFVDKPDARPEIWAYGLRNIWRMAFDPKTGQLWAGEVGQNLWEEINIITRGGNYGWNRRESLHPFGVKGTGPKPEFIDPIWEYHHDIGKSITGGCVCRSPRLPELDGHYLYADYVSGRIWGLKYDETKKRVVANRPIKDRGLPIISFGEDEKGEVYLLTSNVTGKGIFWLSRYSEGLH